MAAYLGKISAVISANTQDFTRKLSTAKSDVDQFKRRLEGIRLNLDMNALDRTLTAVQRMQRMFQEAKKLKIDTSDLQRMYRIFEDVGRPLTSVKNQIEGMSYAVQAQLYPALGKAQKGFQDLYERVKAGGRASASEVENLRAQIERLNASVSVVKGISSLNDAVSGTAAGPTFVQARAEEALRKAAAARSAAARLPGSVREDPFFQRLVGDTAEAGNEITRLTAKVEKFKLALANNPGLAGSPKFMASFAATQDQLDGIVGKLEKLNAMSNGRVGNINTASALNDKISEMLPSKDAARQQIIRNYRDDLRGIAAGSGTSADQAADRAEARARAQEALNREALVSGPAARAKDLVDRAMGTKDAGLAAEAENIKKLAANTSAAAGDTTMFKAKMDALVTTLDAFDRKVTQAETSAKRFKLLLAASGSSAEKLDPYMQNSAVAIQVARQLRGNFGAENLSGRINVSSAIEQQLTRLQKLDDTRTSIAGRQFKDIGGMTGEQRKARALRKLEQRQEAMDNELMNAVADQSGGVFSRDQAARAFGRAKKNQGSMGVGGFAGADLAFQQAMFAVDDLMSATGGLEYKIRAISNNITQMGLMLGQSGLIKGLTATKGLFVGLGAVMAGQVAIQFIKHMHLFQEYEKRADILNDLLDKQRDKAKTAAEAFGQLAESIRDAGMSEQFAQGAGRRRQIADVTRKNADLLQARMAVQTPEIVANLAKQAALKEEQKNNGGDFALIAGREKLIQDLQREEVTMRERLRKEKAPPDPGAMLADFQRRQIMAKAETEAAAIRLGAGRPNIAAAARGTDRIVAAQQQADAIVSQKFKSTKDALEAFKKELSLAAKAQRENEITSIVDPLAQAERNKIVAGLEKAIAALELQVSVEEFDRLAKVVYAAADDIGAAQKKLASAVESGVPAALRLEIELGSLSEEMEAMLREANRLRSEKALDAAAAMERRAEEVAARRQPLLDKARDVALEASLNPLGALGGVAGEQSAAAESILSKSNAARMKWQMGEWEAMKNKAERDNIPEDSKAADDFANALKNMTEKMLAATQASNEFARVIEEFATGLAKEAMEELRGESKKALRAVNKAVGAEAISNGMGGFSARSQEARRDYVTIEDARRATERDQIALQRRFERKRQEFELGVLNGTGNPQDVERAKRIREFEARASNANLSAEQQLAAKQEADRLRKEQERAIERSFGGDFRKEANEIDRRAQADMELVERRRRGREMVLSDSTKRREEAERKGLDIVAALTERDENGNPLFPVGDARNAAAKNAMSAITKDIAPLVASFGEEVLNARLQGPSRQALNASDVTTTQGASELGRLLRGDDSAKEANLVELQKQTSALEAVQKILENQAIVDLR